MRKGFNGLSMLAQEALKKDPFSGHLFVFRGRRGHLVKVLYWDGQGFVSDGVDAPRRHPCAKVAVFRTRNRGGVRGEG
jgi:IS66 Orf2 like protein